MGSFKDYNKTCGLENAYYLTSRTTIKFREGTLFHGVNSLKSSQVIQLAEIIKICLNCLGFMTSYRPF